MNRALLRLLLIGLVSMVLWPGRLAAHPGHEHEDQPATPNLRRWIDTETGQEWQATYVTSQSGHVQLRTEQGELVRVALDRLTTLDRQWVKRRELEIQIVNHTPQQTFGVAQVAAENVAANAKATLEAAFAPFVKRKAINVRSDRDYFYVESNGMPEHGMMIGITAWQQQVPLPQKYTGDNAWRLPLHPVPAKEPAMIKGRFLRGAIALGVNGIPIFNPQNNRGDVSYEIGELDEWGGHCGRADDYHYHIVPVHLEKIVGKNQPVAYALDGYPIYGYQDEKAPDFAPLDRLSGHKDKDGNYHYHATKTYPYVIGGFYGEVVEREEQVDPQPRAQPVREYLQALRGAKIVDFKELKSGSYLLTYEIQGKPGTVAYTINNDGSTAFKFTDTSGKTESETYTPRRRPPGGGKQDVKGPPPRKNDKGKGPPRKGDGPPPKDDGKGPPPGEARKPWIAEHFAELDADNDGELTREEMQAEAARTFAAYDENNDGKLTVREYDRGGVKTAFAGFVRGHADEVDADGDEIITKQELLDFAENLFNKADRDRNGSTTLAESSVGGPGKPR